MINKFLKDMEQYNEEIHDEKLSKEQEVGNDLFVTYLNDLVSSDN